MTALLLTRSFPPAVGGIETYVAELFRRVTEPVTVVAPNRSGAEGFDAAYRHSVRRYWYPWHSDSGKLPLAGLAAAAVPTAVFSRPHVIISEQVQTAAVGIPLAKALGVPHVVFAYGMELSPLRLRRVKHWAFRSSDHVVPISRFARDSVARIYGVSQGDMTIAAPGIRPELFTAAAEIPRWPKRSRGPSLLTLGRLDPTQRYKGYDRVIRLAASLRAEFPGVRCVVAGSGPDRTWLESVARDAGAGDIVEFRGYVPDADIPALFAEADVFVLPSGDADTRSMLVEGYGIVLAEAAAAGVPGIAFRTGGVVDVVVDGVTGILTDASETALLSATRDLLREHTRRENMGRRAAEHARENLGWEKSVSAVNGIIAGMRHRPSLLHAS